MGKKKNELAKVDKNLQKELEKEIIEEYKQAAKERIKQKMLEVRRARYVLSKLENELNEMLKGKKYQEEDFLFEE